MHLARSEAAVFGGGSGLCLWHMEEQNKRTKIRGRRANGFIETRTDSTRESWGHLWWT